MVNAGGATNISSQLQAGSSKKGMGSAAATAAKEAPNTSSSSSRGDESAASGAGGAGFIRAVRLGSRSDRSTSIEAVGVVTHTGMLFPLGVETAATLEEVFPLRTGLLYRWLEWERQVLYNVGCLVYGSLSGSMGVHLVFG